MGAQRQAAAGAAVQDALNVQDVLQRIIQLAADGPEIKSLVKSLTKLSLVSLRWKVVVENTPLELSRSFDEYNGINDKAMEWICSTARYQLKLKSFSSSSTCSTSWLSNRLFLDNQVTAISLSTLYKLPHTVAFCLPHICATNSRSD